MSRSEFTANLELMRYANHRQPTVGRTFHHPAPVRRRVARPGLMARILRAIFG